MTKNLLLILTALAVTSGIVARGTRSTEEAAVQPAVATGTATPEANASRLAAPASSIVSPFGRGQPQATTDPALRRQLRQKKLESLGYSTPPDYYRMPLKSLYQLADRGDLFAMIQLGEQYYSETLDLESDPDFDVRLPPRQIGMQYLQDAALAGHVHVALIVANKFLESNQPDEAYAWARLAEQLGDRGAARPARQILDGLTPAQLKSANARFDDLYFRATARFN